jgi:hypothetical protein
MNWPQRSAAARAHSPRVTGDGLLRPNLRLADSIIAGVCMLLVRASRLVRPAIVLSDKFKRGERRLDVIEFLAVFSKDRRRGDGPATYRRTLSIDRIRTAGGRLAPFAAAGCPNNRDRCKATAAEPTASTSATIHRLTTPGQNRSASCSRNDRSCERTTSARSSQRCSWRSTARRSSFNASPLILKIDHISRGANRLQHRAAA